jgi:protein SCO1/2
MLGKVRIVLWAAVAVALVGAVALLVTTRPQAERNNDALAIGGDFTLTGTDGKPFASSRLEGRPHALFFGFTNCPDVCPTTLARLAKLRKALGRGDSAFDIVLVSVDPERDTPEAMKDYVAMFGTPVIGLTGSPAEIDRVKKLYSIYAAKAPHGQAGHYNVDHSAQVLLFDRDGRFSGTIAREEGDPAAVAKLRNIAA